MVIGWKLHGDGRTPPPGEVVRPEDAGGGIIAPQEEEIGGPVRPGRGAAAASGAPETDAG